jgi:serine/threonine-protein kinase
MHQGTSPEASPASDPVVAAQVEAQLERILGSPQFIKSERMSRFLRFVVERALHGSEGDLKEYSVGIEVFDKDPSFDPRIDNNVRSEARRLRAKLAEYYAQSGQSDAVLIELPKGSYLPRFLAGKPPTPASAPEHSPPTRRLRRPFPRLGILAVAAVLIVAVTIVVWQRLQLVRPIPRFRSIAVLPFLNLSGGDENEYFTAGLTEEIHNHLTGVPSLKVVARTSSSQYKGHDEDVRTIGKRLNVDTVLEGSVRRMGNRLRITPKLISTADGYSVWAETFERDADDLFAIQDEISLQVAHALGVAVVVRATLPPPNPKAYRLSLQARYHWNRWNPDNMKRSIALFEEAISIDPKYARAYAGLASAYGVLGALGGAPPNEAAAKSRTAARKAVELDPNSGDGYEVLACLKAAVDRDWDGASDDFQRALALSPGSADILDDYAILYLTPRRRLSEAETAARHALELDPLSLRINTDLGLVLYFRGDYEAAIAQFHQALDLDPSFANASMQLFKCFLMTRQFTEARRIIEPREKSPYPGEFSLHMGRLQARSGNLQDAQRLLRELTRECAVQCTLPPSQIAWLQTSLGDIDGAFQSLNREPSVMLQVDPEFDRLRTDPRYHALQVKMHFAR